MYSSFNNWTTYQEGQDATPYFLGPNEFNLMVNSAFTNWGPYDGTNHTYSDLYTGTGAPVNFMVFDGNSNSGPAAFNSGWYGDNNGILSVAIYSCDPVVTTGTISGEKYNDKNRDGKLDNNEQGLPGWTIRLEDKNNHVIKTAITDASGNYSFTDLTPGIYKIREVHKNGWNRMSKNPKPIVLSAGDVITNVDFGNAQLRRGDRQDNNQDDQRDDQQGYYYGNHGWSDYGKDWNNKDHQQPDNNNQNQFGFGNGFGNNGNNKNDH